MATQTTEDRSNDFSRSKPHKALVPITIEAIEGSSGITRKVDEVGSSYKVILIQSSGTRTSLDRSQVHKGVATLVD